MEDRKNRLEELRTARGLSRFQLGIQLDPPTTSQTIWNWEHGKTSIKDWRKAQLARLFGVSISYLMGWEEPEGPGWPE